MMSTSKRNFKINAAINPTNNLYIKINIPQSLLEYEFSYSDGNSHSFLCSASQKSPLTWGKLYIHASNNLARLLIFHLE